MERAVGVERVFGVQCLSSATANFPGDEALVAAMTQLQSVCGAVVASAGVSAAEEHARFMSAAVRAKRSAELLKEEALRGDLQTEGELTRAQLLDFFARNTAQLDSEATRTKYRRLARTPEGLADLARVMVEQQQGVFPQMGVSRALGAAALHQLAQEDGDLLATVKAFALKCGEAWIRAVRDNKPKKLQASGRLSRLQVLNFAEGCVNLVQLPETRAALRAAYLGAPGQGQARLQGRGGPAPLSVQLQRDLLAALGVEPNWGVGQLNSVGAVYGRDGEVMAKMQAFQRAATHAVNMSQLSDEQVEEREKEMARQQAAAQAAQQRRQARMVQVQAAVKALGEDDKARIKERMAKKWMTLMRLPQQERMAYLGRQPESDQTDFTMMSAIMMEEKFLEAAKVNAARSAEQAAVGSEAALGSE